MEEQVTAFFGVVQGICAQVATHKRLRIDLRRRVFENRAFTTQLLGGLKGYAEGGLNVPMVISRDPPMPAYGTRAYYCPREPHHIWVTDDADSLERLYLMAHETAHAIAAPHVIGDVRGAGTFYTNQKVAQSYGLGEVVAETAAYLATRPYITLTNGIAPVYVASYAIRARRPEALLAQALPHTVATATTLREVLERAHDHGG